LGFSFFDKDGTLIFKIGDTWKGNNKETIQIGEDERIVGVKAKLYKDDQSVYMYTDF